MATSRLWRKTVTDVMAKEFPQLKLGHHLIDSAAMLMVKNPARAQRHHRHEQSVRRHHLGRGVGDSGLVGFAAQREFDGLAGWQEQV